MSITISQNYAQIGVNTIPCKLGINTRFSKLEFRQKHGKVNIETELPKVLIDQSEAFASAGLKNVFQVTKEEAQQGIQNALQYTKKVAGDGDTMAAIETKSNAIAAISRREFYQIKEWNIDFIPKARPKVDVTGSIDIEAERNWEGINNGVEGEFTPQDISMEYTPGQVKIFLRQYASIDISYQDSKLDTKI